MRRLSLLMEENAELWEFYVSAIFLLGVIHLSFCTLGLYYEMISEDQIIYHFAKCTCFSAR